MSATAELRSTQGTGLLYGAAYYHEYQPYERLDRDLKLMAEAGLNVARVGESTWATWEPVPYGGRQNVDSALPARARATAWADGLEREGATPLASYDHPHFGCFAAVTSHRFGQGQVTYVGTLPNRELGRAVAEPVLAEAGIRTASADLPGSVRVTSARARDGRRLWFVSNWSWDRVAVPTPAAGNALLSGRDLFQGGAIELGAWDVDVVVEAQPGKE